MVTTEFWKELEESIEEGALTETCLELLSKDAALLSSKNANLLPTEFVCSQEQFSPYTRDVLDELIEEGAPVTEACYDGVFEGNYGQCLSFDMIVSLVKSGYFPWELNGERTLDMLAEAVDGENELLKETVLTLLRKCTSKLQDGEAYAKDGAFAEWRKWFKEVNGHDVEERESKKEGEKDVGARNDEQACEKTPSPKSVTTLPTKVNKTNSAVKDKPSGPKCPGCWQRFATKEELNAHRAIYKHMCPINGCQHEYPTHPELQHHLATCNGKAHQKWRKANQKRRKANSTSEPAPKRMRT